MGTMDTNELMYQGEPVKQDVKHRTKYDNDGNQNHYWAIVYQVYVQPQKMLVATVDAVTATITVDAYTKSSPMGVRLNSFSEGERENWTAYIASFNTPELIHARVLRIIREYADSLQVLASFAHRTVYHFQVTKDYQSLVKFVDIEDWQGLLWWQVIKQAENVKEATAGDIPF